MTIRPEIVYVGVNDHDLDLFEAQYAVPHGMSYNSYVITDEKVAADKGFCHHAGNHGKIPFSCLTVLMRSELPRE